MNSPMSTPERILRRLRFPPILYQPGMEKMHSTATLPADHVFPEPAFTSYTHDERKRRMPQCIGHRGFNAKFPENTMLSFTEAVHAGVDSLETDVHYTKDGVVVLSHDASLKRCFGRDAQLRHLEWEEVQHARTIAPPHVPMPRLLDLLEYLAQPALADIWLLLDIKLDNDAETIMRLIGASLAAVPPGPSGKPWTDRVLLGVWAARYLPLAMQHLPGFPVTHIGFSISYARHFLSVPDVSFNMLFPTLLAPGGASFLAAARRQHRRVYTWTVNDEDKMRWCVRRGLDGVVTDDPSKFRAVCRRMDDWSPGPRLAFRWTVYLDVLRVYIFISVATWIWRGRLRPVASPALIRRQ